MLRIDFEMSPIQSIDIDTAESSLIAKFLAMVNDAIAATDATKIGDSMAIAALRVWSDPSRAVAKIVSLQEQLIELLGSEAAESCYRTVLELSVLGDSDMDTDVPVHRLAAFRKFESDLERLIEDHPNEWVAYCGNEELRTAKSRAELIRQCAEKGHTYEDLTLIFIEREASLEHVEQ